ncbi:hypothetical protein KBA73_00725 [Patescibacteria group bacterium]|nr:hypothetical protein [Patescibacteria group bacterium]
MDSLKKPPEPVTQVAVWRCLLAGSAETAQTSPDGCPLVEDVNRKLHTEFGSQLSEALAIVQELLGEKKVRWHSVTTDRGLKSMLELIQPPKKMPPPDPLPIPEEAPVEELASSSPAPTLSGRKHFAYLLPREQAVYDHLVSQIPAEELAKWSGASADGPCIQLNSYTLITLTSASLTEGEDILHRFIQAGLLEALGNDSYRMLIHPGNLLTHTIEARRPKRTSAVRMEVIKRLRTEFVPDEQQGHRTLLEWLRQTFPKQTAQALYTSLVGNPTSLIQNATSQLFIIRAITGRYWITLPGLEAFVFDTFPEKEVRPFPEPPPLPEQVADAAEPIPVPVMEVTPPLAPAPVVEAAPLIAPAAPTPPTPQAPVKDLSMNSTLALPSTDRAEIAAAKLAKSLKTVNQDPEAVLVALEECLEIDEETLRETDALLLRLQELRDKTERNRAHNLKRREGVRRYEEQMRQINAELAAEGLALHQTASP